MKILHLPSSVGNHGYSLAKAERELGYDSENIVFGRNPLQMNNDYFVQRNGRFRYAAKVFAEFSKIRKSYDIFHFNFGRTMFGTLGQKFNGIDLPYYQGRLFMSFNGSDLRRDESVSINPYGIYPTEFLSDEEVSIFDKKKKRLDRMLPYLEHCFVTTPDLLSFLPAEKVTYVPHIKDKLRDGLGTGKRAGDEWFDIVHAPTNRFYKGSDTIVRALNRLAEENPRVRFRLLEGLPHDQVIEEYRKADLVVDQVRLGWYGAVSLEAMMCGCPSAVYLNDEYIKRVDGSMAASIPESFLIVNPDNIHDKISGYIEDYLWQKRLKLNCQNYVRQFHDPTDLIKIIVSRYFS